MTQNTPDGETEETSETDEHTPDEFEHLSRSAMINYLCMLSNRNDALIHTLHSARNELREIRAQIDDMGEPPFTYAVLTGTSNYRDDQRQWHTRAEITDTHSHQLVAIAPNIHIEQKDIGHTVLIDARRRLTQILDTTQTTGTVRRIRAAIDNNRMLVETATGGLTAVQTATSLEKTPREGDDVLLDPSGTLILEILPREDAEDQVLEETPDVTFDDIGGLDNQIERIRDAVELPFLKRDLYQRFGLTAPRGVLLYGPPGNGKTMIAKAIAHALATGFAESTAAETATDESTVSKNSTTMICTQSKAVHPASGNTEHSDEPHSAPSAARGVFLSLKGPEILSKYVGEAERILRSVFERARERAAQGVPVVVFIDEMDSLLRTRGTGVSSDVETTIVPQFLAELDGVEELGNVIVIGASNRVDMIDPAVLRPGRLDVKIRIDRPGPEQALDIVRRYVSDDLPLEAGVDEVRLARVLVDDLYARVPGRFMCSVRMGRGVADAPGPWRDVYLGDLCSGAMLADAVARAKRSALKRSITQGVEAIVTLDDVRGAVEGEFVEMSGSLRQTAGSAGLLQWAQIMGIGADDGLVVADVSFTPSGV